MPLQGRIQGRKKSIRGSVGGAMDEVAETANFYEAIGRKIEKFGIRIEVVQIFPKPIFDFKIKSK